MLTLLRSTACPVAAVVILAACGGGDDAVRVSANGTPVGVLGAVAPEPRVLPPTPAPLPFTPDSPASDLDPEDLHGFGFPVAGGCLPGFDGLMPNAPRLERNSPHAGVDWYPGSGCAAIETGTPVYAMNGGVVVRADHDYVDITPAQIRDLEARRAAQGHTDDEVLDLLHGRQVWIDHGQGVVTRYAHLSAVPPGLFVGLGVERGDIVGFIGDSGTPESVTAPGAEIHLHAEVRVGDSYFGAGLPPSEVRALYERLFTPSADTVRLAGD